jgi:GT2 family glycosyltransferase
VLLHLWRHRHRRVRLSRPRPTGALTATACGDLGERGAVDVVLVAYRSGERLAAALRGLADEPGIADVVVVDHGDGTDAELAASLGARALHVPTNPGYGAGQNLGVGLGAAPLVLLLNPDAQVVPGALAAGRLALASRPDVAAVQGIVQRESDGRPERSQGGALTPVHLWGRALHLRALLDVPLVRALARRASRLADHVDRVPDGEVEVEALAAVSVLVRREAFEAIGGFDERYFLYGEDLDLCRRLRAAGWTLLALPEPWSVHAGGASAASTAARERTWWRGTLRYAASWWPDRDWRLGVAAAALVAARLAADDPRGARATWDALVAGPRRDRAAILRGDVDPWPARPSAAVTSPPATARPDGAGADGRATAEVAAR